jgi:ankyrin repeat protein
MVNKKKRSKKKRNRNIDGMFSMIKNLFSLTQERLFTGIRNRNFIECQRLLQNGVELNNLYNGYSFLFWAFNFLNEEENESHKRDYYDIIILLLLYGADINKKMDYDTYFEVSLLIIFTIKNKISFVRFLLEQPNIDINSKSLEGNTALMYAARYNRPTILNLLLEHGANIYIQNVYGQTALSLTNNYPPLSNPIREKDRQIKEKELLDNKKIAG